MPQPLQRRNKEFDFFVVEVKKPGGGESVQVESDYVKL